MSPGQPNPTPVSPYGVALSLYPGDTGFWMEVERAPDQGGNPDEPSSVVVARVAPGTRHCIDLLPATADFYHYRMYHVGDEYAPSETPTGWIRVRAVQLPERLPLDTLPAKPLLDADLILDAIDGTVDLVVDSELPNGSVRWAVSTTDFPAEGTGTIANLDANGDTRVVDIIDLAVNETAYARVTFYEGVGGAGNLRGSLRVSKTYTGTALPNDTIVMENVSLTWVNGQLTVRWDTALFPPGARVIVMDDPSDTTDAAWNVLSQGAKDTKWAAGIELGRETTGVFILPPERTTQRVYSIMIRLEALGGAEGPIYHAHVADAAPNANGSLLTLRQIGRNISVEIDDVALTNASRFRLHQGATSGFVPDESTVKAVGVLPHSFLAAIVGALFGGTATPTPSRKVITGYQLDESFLLDDLTEIYVKLECWDVMSDALGEAHSFSTVMSVTPGPVPESDFEKPNDPSSLDQLQLSFTVDGRLSVEAHRLNREPWANTVRLEIRRDPTNTSSAQWALLSDPVRITKWDGGTVLAANSGTAWQSPPAFLTQRAYSVMARTVAQGGAMSAPIHGYVENLAPDASQAGTITIYHAARHIAVEITNLAAVNGSMIRLHRGTSTGFTPSDSTVVAYAPIMNVFPGSKIQLIHEEPSGTTFGTTRYYKLEVIDDLTVPLAESPSYSSQFTHTFQAQSGTIDVSLAAGAPDGTLSPTGIALTSNSNATYDYQLQWTFSQGAAIADFIVLFDVEGLSAPTGVDGAIFVKPDSGSGRHYSYKGIDGSKFWSFGIAMGRRTVNGVEISVIQSPTSSPDWRGVTPLGNDFTDSISGTAAATVEGGAVRANTGLDGSGNLQSDITGDTNVLANGRIYVGSGGGLEMGQSGSPSPRTKTVRVQASELTPGDFQQTYAHTTSYVHTYDLASTQWFAPVLLSPGSIITGFEAELYRQTTSDFAKCELYYTSSAGGSATSLASRQHSSTGWSTITGSLSHTTSDSNRYLVYVDLDSATGGLDSRFASFKVTYTVPDYETAL